VGFERGDWVRGRLGDGVSGDGETGGWGDREKVKSE